jgi:MHS family proline/betaine transporter-like MFS transporter
VRLTGVSIAYNLSTAIFGGFAPFVAQYLIGATGNPAALSYCTIGGAIVSLFFLVRAKESAFHPLR